MKEILSRDGIPVPPFRKINDVYDILDFIRVHDYPVIIKPVMLHSAINTEKISNRQELLNFLSHIELNNMMIEKYMSYDMVSCNGFILNNNVVFPPLQYT